MKIVVASDSFKGSLSSEEIIDIARETASKIRPNASCVGIPMADGGEGTLDALLEAVPAAEAVGVTVHGPLGDPHLARLALMPASGGTGKRALVEMAEASGLTLIDAARRDPLRTSSYGTGELVRAALDRGAREITLAVGGSATNDGGMGFLRALGARLFDSNGAELAGTGADLERAASADLSGLDPRLAGRDMTVMSDVDNPLLGPDGATYVFGPQKGADSEMLGRLERGMRNYAEVLARASGRDCGAVPGAGAAGGLAFAALTCLGAQLVPGAEAMLDLASFDRLVADADLCITGEGRLDAQTAHGKVVSAVAARCANAGVPCIALVGGADAGVSAGELHLAGIEAITPEGMPLGEAMRHAPELYRQALARVLEEHVPHACNQA